MSQKDPDLREQDASRLVPYAADFTPTMLGKIVGPDAVLTWLLNVVAATPKASEAQKLIEETCFEGVERATDRRDMARRILNSLKSYKLATIEEGALGLTPVGIALRSAKPDEVDLVFARHILTECNGQRFVDAVLRYQLRGETPDLEDLAIELDRHATSKSVSSMRAWLARAGVVTASGVYRIDPEAVDRILGAGSGDLYGLTAAELEFLLAARIVVAQKKGQAELNAPEVAAVVKHRAPDVRLKLKSLGGLVRRLEERGFVTSRDRRAGRGGSRVSFALTKKGVQLTEDQLRGLLSQSDTGFPLAELSPLEDVVARLADGHAEQLGRVGEMLAVHLCLMLGLKVTNWRLRAPQAEIDLLAERTVALTYQRWAVQVKNLESDRDLDGDRVDREIGAAAGSGTSHILFVVPRSALTEAARREILVRSALTPLHIFALARDDLAEKSGEALLARLRKQERLLAEVKRREALRRDDALR